MTLISRLQNVAGLVRGAFNGETRAAPLSWASIVEALTGVKPGLDLPTVTPTSALKTSAVWGCMQVLSNAYARVPVVVFRKTAAGRERAEDHPAYRLLKVRPNSHMTAFQFHRAMELNRLGYGRGLAIIERVNGRPVALWPVHGSRVRVFVKDGSILYAVATDNAGEYPSSGGGWTLAAPTTGDDRYQIFTSFDVLDFQGMSFDGVNCLSVVDHMKTVVQQYIAAEKTATTFAAQGVKAGGFLEVPTKLTDEAHKRLQTSFNASYGRQDFAGKTVVLEGGTTFKAAPAMMSLADAQWIESSKMRIEDIARFFGVPLHLIQSLDRATNNNIEHQSLDFLNHSLAPQLDNAAQEMTFKLLTEEEQADMYIGHIKQAIMSVDSRSRAEYLMRMHQMGVLNGDMIADLEDVNRPTDGRGQVYYVPVNLAPAMTPDEAKKKMEADAAPPAPPEPPDPSGDDSNDDDADEEVAQ